MVYFEFILRIVGITLLLALVWAIVRDAWHVRAARFGFFLAISLCAVLATSVSQQSIAPPKWLFIPLSLLSSSSAILIWWYSLSLFEDDFRLGWREWGIAGLWTSLGIYNLPSYLSESNNLYSFAVIARSFIAITLAAHIVYIALAGRKGDLLEKRRRVRSFYALAIITLFLIDLFGERIFNSYYTPLHVNIIQLSAFLAVIIWSFFWLFRIEANVLSFNPAPTQKSEEDSSLNTREKQIHERLCHAMEIEKAYLDPDLSIGSLAERIAVPEHQLRALINKTMEHRNFRSYLNGYRMAAVKAALADPARVNEQILTIAMGAGFASLASFNRAFKLATGVTPSQFRKAALSAG